MNLVLPELVNETLLPNYSVARFPSRRIRCNYLNKMPRRLYLTTRVREREREREREKEIDRD